jgi:purine-binding chemotaxis protein CheW
MEEQLVVFELGNENYGLDISTVEGIIKMQTIIKMPKAPEFVEGVTNLRGMVVPVIDLRKRFGLPSIENNRDTRIVVVFLNKTKVGMVVDGVSEVLRVQVEDIEPTPPMVSTADTTFIRGIAKLDGRLITLLDLSKVLSTSESNSIALLSS